MKLKKGDSSLLPSSSSFESEPFISRSRSAARRTVIKAEQMSPILQGFPRGGVQLVYADMETKVPPSKFLPEFKERDAEEKKKIFSPLLDEKDFRRSDESLTPPVKVPPHIPVPPQAPKEPKTFERIVQKKRPTQRNIWRQFVDFCFGFNNIFRWMLYLLIACYWIFLLLYLKPKPVKTGEPGHKMHGVVYQGKEKQYIVIKAPPDETVTINVDIWGPFVTAAVQTTLGTKIQGRCFQITLERWDGTLPAGTLPDKPSGIKSIGGTSTALHEILMVEPVLQNDRWTWDYNRYPTKGTLTLKYAVTSSVKTVLGFGPKTKADQSIPFSFTYTSDALTPYEKTLYSMIPIIVVSVFNIAQVNKVVSALFGMVTLAYCYLKVGNDPHISTVVKWFDYDWLFYLCAVLLYFPLLAETNIQSFLAYYWLYITKMNVLLSIAMLNILTAVGCMFFNNVFICVFCLLIGIRIMELLKLDPVPMIINILIVANIYGRCWMGTYESQKLLDNPDANDTVPILNWKSGGVINLQQCSFKTATLTGLFTQFCWLLTHLLCHPTQFKGMVQIEEDQHMMRLIDHSYMSIPDFSVTWHRVRSKLLSVKSFLAFEIREMRARLRQYGPEPEKTTEEKLQEIYPECRIRNYFLLLKMLVGGGLFVYLMVCHIYHLDIYYLEDSKTVEKMRLGFVALYIIVYLLLMVHSRELDMVAKRMDWEALIYMAVISCFAYVLNETYPKMHDYIWKKSGTSIKGAVKEKRQQALLQIMGITPIASFFSDYFVFATLINTAFKYSIGEGFNSIKILLMAFHHSIGLWGMATPFGTSVNIIGVGWAAMNGYYNKLTLYRFMRYGLPFAIVSNGFLFVYSYFYITDEKYN